MMMFLFLVEYSLATGASVSIESDISELLLLPSSSATDENQGDCLHILSIKSESILR